MIHYYVDPGSGFVFGQGASFLWATALGAMGGLFLFFRLFQRFCKPLLSILLIIVALIIGGLRMQKPHIQKKVVVIGIDAMDPKVVESLIAQGRLPNLALLRKSGSYAALSTTLPSETAVAWASFSTGLSPADHGIFDFIMRNPDNYSLYLSLNEMTSSEGKIHIAIRKRGTDVWSALSKHRVPSAIYFCPNTFPPSRLLGTMLCGMGVPDITGTMGAYTFYTTKDVSSVQDSRGKLLQVKSEEGIIQTMLYGPKVVSRGKPRESAVALKIIMKPDRTALLELQGKQILLRENTWSDWAHVSFPLGFFKKARGIVKFYLSSFGPEFALYTTPVSFDPRNPLFPISYPLGHSKQLSKAVGSYATLGTPVDTWGLSENRIDEKAFLEYVDSILEERERLLQYALKEYKGGLLFFYFDTLDTVQHMFWRYLDPRHPLHEADSPFKETIFKYYEKMDRMIGDVMKRLDKDALLILLSDHGFTSFRRAVNINSWLLQQGYLSLNQGKGSGGEFLEDVDWSKTKAYALGFGGIYFNKIGREYYGIVSDKETAALQENIIKGLSLLVDPATGEKIVHTVYTQKEVFQGASQKDAPDLFVGFNPGYRVSWHTALGGAPTGIIEDNTKKWSGDHMVDSSLVPGVIFLNKRVPLDTPSILDVAPTILGVFGIKELPAQTGKGLLNKSTE